MDADGDGEVAGIGKDSFGLPSWRMIGSNRAFKTSLPCETRESSSLERLDEASEDEDDEEM